VNEMNKPLATRVKKMISALKNWQEVLAANGQLESSQLLGICKLDLEMKLGDISDTELSRFSEAIRKNISVTVAPDRPLSALGPHLRGSERLPHRHNISIMNEAKTANRVKSSNRK
jgi:hypothetical protein